MQGYIVGMGSCLAADILSDIHLIPSYTTKFTNRALVNIAGDKVDLIPRSCML